MQIGWINGAILPHTRCRFDEPMMSEGIAANGYIDLFTYWMRVPLLSSR